MLEAKFACLECGDTRIIRLTGSDKHPAEVKCDECYTWHPVIGVKKIPGAWDFKLVVRLGDSEIESGL